jgi:hypothetical protein
MLILDLKAQSAIQELIRRAAARPLSRSTVEDQTRRLRRGKSVPPDPSCCVMIPEDYLATFCIEDAPFLGLVRHLAVSRGKAKPERAAVEMLKREFGITTRMGELCWWFQPVPGRGTAVHLLEPVTGFNSAGLPLPSQAAALVVGDFVVDPELEEEAA